jgi:flagellar basal-body rod modification protein FlgD
MSAINQSATSGALAGTRSNRTAASTGGVTSDPYNELGTEGFLKLLINELQNQDPLNPMDNAAMVQQIGEIRQISATDALTTTLSNLSHSQELVTASGLIGHTVAGLGTDSTEISGKVDRVTVETNSENKSRSVKVHVGQKTMEVKNIREILTG